MNDESAFLRTIIESPDDDTPRLVFSDWLEENGQSDRAEFIRTQIRLAQMNSWDEGWTELRHRERYLLRKYATKWLEPIAEFLPSVFLNDRRYEGFQVFRRGMIDTPFVDAEPFINAPNGLFDAAPVRGLIVSDRHGLLQCPALARLQRLELINALESTWDVAGISYCPHLKNLRELTLTAQRIPIHGLRNVIRSPYLSNLEALNLSFEALGAEGFDTLGRETELPNLRRLNVNVTTPASFRAWSRGGWPQRLKELRIGWGLIPIDDFTNYFMSGDWSELRSLSVSQLGEGADLGNLASVLTRMPRLERFDLESRRFTWDSDLDARGHRFESLRSLNLSRSYRAMDGASIFCDSFPNLSELDLSYNELEGGVLPLRDTPMAESLRVLDVTRCGISAEEFGAFVKSVRMPNLESLSIGGLRGLTPKSIRLLGESQQFPQLRNLSVEIQGNAKAYQTLVEMPILEQLTGLTVHGGEVTPKCVEILIESQELERLSEFRLFSGTFRKIDSERLRAHFGEHSVR